MTDEYNGWSNRETWCAELWLSNDQGTYNMVTEWAADAWALREDRPYPDISTGQQHATGLLADQLEDWFTEMTANMVDDPESLTEEARLMLTDIGSLYRIDWYEIAEGWVTAAVEADPPRQDATG